MNCETVRKHLLALEDPNRVPEKLRAHLAGCSTCVHLVGQVARLDDLLTRLPHPSSTGVKAAFLEHLQAPANDNPLKFGETTRTATPSRQKERLGVREWRLGAVLTGLAAGILTMALVWSGTHTKRGVNSTGVESAIRDELLKKEVGHLVALAQADSASKRMALWSQIAVEFRAEAANVYRAAQADDMAAIAKMYEKAVHDGIVPQAEQLPHYISMAERKDLLASVTEKLKKTEDEAERLASQAPPQSQPSLKRIAQTAREGYAKLDVLTRG